MGRLKLLCLRPAFTRPFLRIIFKPLYCFTNALLRLRVKEASRHALDDAVTHAAFPVGDDGRAAGHGLDGCDAEVLLRGEDKSPGVLHAAAEDVIGLVAEDADVLRRAAHDGRMLRAVADDDELFPRHEAECLDDEVHSFIGDEAGGREVVVLLFRAEGEFLHIHGWMDNGGFPAVDLSDAPGDEARVRDVGIDAEGCPAIPDAQVVQQELRRPALEPVVEPGVPQVGKGHIPGIAHGRVHIGDMQLIRAGDDALRDTVRARDDEVVAPHVDLLDGQRHQRKIGAVMAPRSGQVLEECRMRLFPPQEASLRLRQEVHETVDIRLRIELQELFQYAFRACVCDEPVTYDCYLIFHAFLPTSYFPHIFLRSSSIIIAQMPPPARHFPFRFTYAAALPVEA